MVSVGKDVTQLRRAAERESTLLLARSVQQRLFPASPVAVPGFDIFGATFVADVTGGDYYDFIPLRGDRLGALVADVSGHGVDSALLMAETRAVLRATAETTAEPSEILAVVNRVLHADTEAHRFATLLLVISPRPHGIAGLRQRGASVRVPPRRPWDDEGRAARHRPAARPLPRFPLRDALRSAPRARRHPRAPDGRRDGLRRSRAGAVRRGAGARGDSSVPPHAPRTSSRGCTRRSGRSRRASRSGTTSRHWW